MTVQQIVQLISILDSKDERSKEMMDKNVEKKLEEYWGKIKTKDKGNKLQSILLFA